MPLVGKFGNKRGLKTVVAFNSYNEESGSDASNLGVIRFIDPESCETIESVRAHFTTRWYNYPSAADLDGDGLLEYIATTGGGKTVAYHWNGEKHVPLWTSTVKAGFMPLIFDVDGDGKPEVLADKSILNGQDGSAWSHPNDTSYHRSKRQ